MDCLQAGQSSPSTLLSSSESEESDMVESLQALSTGTQPSSTAAGERDSSANGIAQSALTMKGKSDILVTAAIAPEKSRVLSLQGVPSGTSSGSDEEPPIQQVLALTPKCAKPHTQADKAAAPAGKHAPPQTVTAAAATNQLQTLADAMRTAPAAVNDGEQRAATKRLQLRNKLKRAHEALDAQSASQKAELIRAKSSDGQAGLSAAAAQAAATAPGNLVAKPHPGVTVPAEPSSSQELLPKQHSAFQLEGTVSELPVLRPSRKMLKRERRRAAAAAAGVAAASSAASSLPEGPSTVEGTSSSSAASLVGSEAGTPPARPQPVAVQQGATTAGTSPAGAQPDDAVQQGMLTAGSDAAAPNIAGDDNGSNSEQGRPSAHAALPSGLPVPHDTAPAASVSGDGTNQGGSLPSGSDTVLEPTPSDSKAVADGAETGLSQPSQQTSTKPQSSNQTPHAAPSHPAVAPAQKADALPAGRPPQVAPPPIRDDSTHRSTLQLGPPPLPNGPADTRRMTNPAMARGGRDARGQPPRPYSLAQQKADRRRPFGAVGGAAPPPPPPPRLQAAAIPAHRPPPAKKVVLRASAAPYTPLSSKVALSDTNKTLATGAKPAASSNTEGQAKSGASGACLALPHNNALLLAVSLV